MVFFYFDRPQVEVTPYFCFVVAREPFNALNYPSLSMVSEWGLLKGIPHPDIPGYLGRP